MEGSNIVVPHMPEYSQFKYFVNCFNFGQYVMEPTRGNNILDLILSNSQMLVENVHVVPGVSDHECGICFSFS